MSNIRTFQTWLVTAAVTGASLLLAFWAGSTLLRDVGPDSVEAAPTVTAKVVEERVGRSLELNASIVWDPVDVIQSPRSGTITRVDQRTDLDHREIVVWTDERPMFVAAGEIPAYRDLAINAEGVDVEQLEDFLVGLGYLEGADEHFGPATARAVRSWQSSLGLTRTGKVKRGDVYFLGRNSGFFEAAVQAGQLVSPGDEVGTVYSRQPRLFIRLAADQAQLIPTGASVVLQLGKAEHSLEVVSVVAADEGTNVLLSSPELTAADFASLFLSAVESLRVTVELVPAASGPTIPIAAIGTNSEGHMQVTMVDGSERRIKVLAASDGRAVVEGVELGESVILSSDVG